MQREGKSVGERNGETMVCSGEVKSIVDIKIYDSRSTIRFLIHHLTVSNMSLIGERVVDVAHPRRRRQTISNLHFTESRKTPVEREK